jgi:DNA repair ATPase RecN
VIWVALLVLVNSLVLGLGVAVYRGVCTWRLLKRTGRAFGAELERISSAAAEIEGQLARADASARKLTEAHERLRASRARLGVQRSALREARTQVARTFWFVPGR